MKLSKIIIAMLLAVLSAAPSFNVCAVTVSSECDISDIAVPISTTVENVPVGTTLDIKAKSAILLEPYSGQILYEINSDEALPPASITKIMSLLLIMEAIDRGTLTLEDVVTCSAHAASMGGSQIWLEEGESMTVDDLLKATVIASANDATVALAEAVAGSEEGFVALMNERAAELGMSGTVFKNATGLDAEGHISTAHDVALMSAALIKFPLIKKYSTVWMDTLRDGQSELVNTNKLVRFYEGTTGLKTGTTSGAGYCLSATAQRDGMELVAVIMSGNTSQDRFEGAKKLLDYGFANFCYTKVTPELGDTTALPVEGGEKQTVNIEPQGDFGALLKKTEAQGITQKPTFKEDLKAPIKKGQSLGTVEIYSGDTQIGAVDIVASETVRKMRFTTALLWLLAGLVEI